MAEHRCNGLTGTPLTLNFRVVNQSPGARLSTEVDAEEVRVYPNPFQGSFRLKSPVKGPLLLYDVSSHKVLELSTVQPEQAIQPSPDLAPGVYFLQVGEGANVQRRKLLKIP
ncbi:T9SS type A sorting domain-containing protein [Larkinella arboricola]|nr:T9SS type A sorting domain-containing protein [Larkinella arboricola]